MIVTVLQYAAIVAVTLVVFDLALIVTGLFPPRTSPGHPDVGWLVAPPTGSMTAETCVEFAENVTYVIERNEAAYRTAASAELLRARRDSLFTVLVSGDSHTDLCIGNAEAHTGYLEAALRAAGRPAVVAGRGSGRYSPLQAYLAVKDGLAEYDAEVFVLNVYTGNDLYDLMRVDDRPHLVATDSGYRVAPPVWYTLDDPAARPKSRVLWVVREIGRATGVRGFVVRLRYLRDSAAEQGASLGAIVRYVRDLRRASSPEVGYPAAFAAQMLNQQLFFHHFPGSRDESLRRMRALLERVRAEQPGRLLVLTPLPSYQLVQESPVDPPFVRIFDRLPISYESGLAEEAAITEALRTMAAETGWIFVDVLPRLRAARGGGRLFNAFDYHLLPAASAVIGRAQADAILVATAGTRRPR